MSDSPSSLTCPDGHPFDPAAGRFCIVCGLAVRCPDGHPVATSDVQFCVECGVALGNTPGPPAWAPRGRPSWLLPGAGAAVVIALAAAGAFVALRPGSEESPSSPGQIARPTATVPTKGGNSEVASLQGTPSATAVYTPAAGSANPSASSPATAAALVATYTAQAPTATKPAAGVVPTTTYTPVPPTATPTHTPTPNPPTAAPTLEPNVGIYGYLTLGGSPCGGCEVSFEKGITGYVLRAGGNGYYDTKAAGFVITPGVWQITYSCGKNWIPTTPSSVTIVAGPQKQLEIKIGFCG